MYYLYIWSVINDVETGLYRDAGNWDERFQNNIRRAEINGLNYRVIRDGKIVKEHIAK